ncbi:MAG: hypothetical protein H7222_12015 [Methylotenera sp.]|nr:hypothetical protein [Oligoflexia bacterium]
MKVIFFFLTSLYSAHAFSGDACKGGNGKPLFGYDETHTINSCDQGFLDQVMKIARGDRKVALQGVLDLGWKAMSQNDLETAVKRFNQAWLVNSQSPAVFEEFAAWEKAHQNAKKEKEFQQKAKALNNSS